jgi:hypothetical protein
MKRKDALKRMRGLAPQIEEHLDKICNDPSSRDVPHWVKEIESWIRQIESLLPYVGERTAEYWGRRIEGWRRGVGQLT